MKKADNKSNVDFFSKKIHIKDLFSFFEKKQVNTRGDTLSRFQKKFGKKSIALS